MSPRQMQRALPRAFRALKATKARFIHYKTCSTFDSSPAVGSIGRAIDLGRRVFGQHITPLVVGVPVLGRHVVFGNLFARSGLDAEVSRLDHHPTMRSHPVTPMDEADLRRHLARQTRLPIELVDILKLRAERLQEERANSNVPAGLAQLLGDLSLRKPPPIVLFDTLDQTDLPAIGQSLSNHRPAAEQIFCAGSSGIEYSLVAHWRTTGVLPTFSDSQPYLNDAPERAPGQIVTISGSCSPVTAVQIANAIKAGFIDVPCDSQLLANEAGCAAGVAQALARARAALDSGRNVIFHTARGATDRRRAGFERSAQNHTGRTRHEKLAKAGAHLGKALSQILDSALRRTGARYAVVCGGDTATHVARALGIEALEFVSPVAPGAPLCRVHAPDSPVHGCQIIFKGGQVGRNSFFSDLANRQPHRETLPDT